MNDESITRLKAWWKVQLTFFCPFCDDEIDYFDTDHFADESSPSFPKIFEGRNNYKIRCDCDHELVLDIQEGNS